MLLGELDTRLCAAHQERRFDYWMEFPSDMTVGDLMTMLENHINPPTEEESEE